MDATNTKHRPTMGGGVKRYLDHFKEQWKTTIMVRGEPQPRTVEVRLDPLFEMHSTIISIERALRSHTFKPSSPIALTPPEKCRFCKKGGLYTETPDERMFHSASTPNPGYELITIQNLFPFLADHRVTIISDDMRELSLMNLQRGDVVRYIESGYELALKFASQSGVTGLADFVNWGPEAGASVDHPHAQRGGLTRLMRTVVDSEIERCESIRRETKGDPFGEYLEMIRKTQELGNQSLYCFENDAVIAFAPFAPTFADQVDIVYKKNANSILDLKSSERELVADAMIKVLHALGSLEGLPEGHKRRNVTNLNVFMHQARFEDKRDYYRVHWHVAPRMNKAGSLEVGYQCNVVDVFPETTASSIRAMISQKAASVSASDQQHP